MGHPRESLALGEAALYSWSIPEGAESRGPSANSNWRGMWAAHPHVHHRREKNEQGKHNPALKDTLLPEKTYSVEWVTPSNQESEKAFIHSSIHLSIHSPIQHRLSNYYVPGTAKNNSHKEP